MRTTQLLCGVTSLLFCAGLATPARAGIIAILDPAGSYLAATNLMPVIGDEFSSIHSVDDGVNTATFFVSPNPFPSDFTIYDAGSGWSTWSSPPYAETDTPRVLGTSPQMEIQLALPALVFGFEAEPNGFGTADITVNFYGGGVLRGSITRSVTGDGGARLFAAFSSLGIDDIVISGTDQFAIAQLRYGNDGSAAAAAPEPGTGLLAAALLLGLLPLRRIRQRAWRPSTFWGKK